MSAYTIRMALDGDDTGIRQLLGAPQPSGLLALGFERSPNYFDAAAVTHEAPDVIVAEQKAAGDIVAVVNMGSRPAYVNGECQPVRFGGDLRIAPSHQGGRLLVYLSRRIREAIGEHGWYQTIILNDNSRSRTAFDSGGRAGMPVYVPQGTVETFTLTGIRRPVAFADCVVRVATAQDVPAMNRFVRRMGRFYQFLPAYDFSGVLAHSPYFRGLSITDFLLVEREGDLAGLGAVWNQKAFKQTRVVSYQPAVRFVRPIYNLWTRLTGGMHLPPEGQLLDYCLAHSPLTAPEDADAMSVLLHALWERCQAKGGRALSLSFSGSDPRRSVISNFRHFSMTGIHYLAGFSSESLPRLDERLVPYFECGRL